MTHALGYYTSYTPGDSGILAQLQNRYDVQLQGLDDTEKLIFRASLAAYRVMRPIWKEEGSSISCVDCCIAGAGGDDYDIWDSNPDLVESIQSVCDNLGDDDIEGLIEALTAQLRYGGQ